MAFEVAGDLVGVLERQRVHEQPVDAEQQAAAAEHVEGGGVRAAVGRALMGRGRNCETVVEEPLRV